MTNKLRIEIVVFLLEDEYTEYDTYNLEEVNYNISELEEVLNLRRLAEKEYEETEIETIEQANFFNIGFEPDNYKYVVKIYNESN